MCNDDGYSSDADDDEPRYAVQNDDADEREPRQPGCDDADAAQHALPMSDADADADCYALYDAADEDSLLMSDESDDTFFLPLMSFSFSLDSTHSIQ